MDIQPYVTPWDIGGAVAGLLLSIAAIISLVLGRHQLGTVIKKVGEKLFSQVGFFSLVIVVFMLISVLESGSFFDQTITHHAILDLLGYALALGFDLVSIVCMQARLNAARMRDERGQRLNLIGVIICAAVSAFANACGSLQGYSPVDLNHTPLWMQTVAPWIGMVFPTMIVVLAMTSDHLLDHTPARDIDVDTYRKQEQKRVDILRVRLDAQKALLSLEKELSTLHQQRNQASGQIQREWLWTRWIRPSVQPPTNLKERIDKAIQDTQGQMLLLQTTMGKLDSKVNEMVISHQASTQSVQSLSTQVDKWTVEVSTYLSTLGEKVDGLNGLLDTLSTQFTRLEQTRGRAQEQKREIAEEKRGNTQRRENREIGQRILDAIQRLGGQASDRQIARDVDCSPTTVARWRQRFEKRG